MKHVADHRNNLKAYFGALFINSYNFPDVNDVKLLLAKFEEMNKQNSDEILLALRILIFEISNIAEELVLCSKCNDSGFFYKQISNYNFMKYFPIYHDSCLTFFEKFLESPRNYTDIDIENLKAWSFVVVNFYESTPQRVTETVNFLLTVKNLINK